MKPEARRTTASRGAQAPGGSAAYLLGASLAVAVLAVYHVLEGAGGAAISRLVGQMAANSDLPVGLWHTAGIIGIATVLGCGVWFAGLGRGRSRARIPRETVSVTP
jgi:hypothetical protein